MAGVFLNRLRQGMKLQSCATVNFALGEWRPLTVADTQIDHPYNTYLHDGLPPGPIGNPGLPSLMAVAKPAQTDCLYYLHDPSRQIHCARTLAEHEQNIATYLP